MAGVLTFSIVAILATAIVVTASALRSSLDEALTSEVEAFRAAIADAPADTPLVDSTRGYLAERESTGAGLDPVLFVQLTDGRTISNSTLRLEDALPADGTALGQDATFSDVVVDGTVYRVLTMTLRSAGQEVGVFRAALSTEIVDRTRREVALTIAAAGAFALALGLPLAFIATRRSLRPLARMAHDAERIAGPNSPSSITYDGPPDELGALADALNAMLDRLESAAAAQRAFVADASHELRTPVAVIRGNAELLRSGALAGDDAGDAISRIEQEAERMGRLLNELLALARLEATGESRFQPLSVRVLLDEAAARCRALGNRDVMIEGPCDLWISGEPDLLDQALANLVRNAVTHTRDDGLISLGCAIVGDYVSITVTDDGPGIPPDEIEHVFDRFRRVGESPRDTSTGGAGLGLAITRRLVELHGGSIHAANVEPHGARFTITLPRITEPE